MEKERKITKKELNEMYSKIYIYCEEHDIDMEAISDQNGIWSEITLLSSVFFNEFSESVEFSEDFCELVYDEMIKYYNFAL